MLSSNLLDRRSMLAHLQKLGADLRSTSPYDTGKPACSGVSGCHECEIARHEISRIDFNLYSSIGQVDHVAGANRKASVQGNPCVRSGRLPQGFAPAVRLSGRTPGIGLSKSEGRQYSTPLAQRREGRDSCTRSCAHISASDNHATAFAGPPLGASSCSMTAASCGWLKRNPWASVQPSVRKTSS